MKKSTKFLIVVVLISFLILAFLGIIVFGLINGWFFSTTNSVTNQYNIPNPSTLTSQSLSYNVNLWFNLNVLCTGDIATGNIDSNIPNGVCALFQQNGANWILLQNYKLDANGHVSDSRQVNVSGTSNIQAICCDLQGVCRVSNQVTLTVNICSTCRDSDGDNKDVPGHVTYGESTYTDRCLDVGQGVTEYLCDGNNVVYKNYACDLGEVCIQSRSGGYCHPTTPNPQYTCSDSDGGINFNTDGNCQDSYHNLGYSDGCISGETYKREYYCDNNNICQWVPNTNWVCSHLACNQIVRPISQSSCDLGNCGEGLDCVFYPATLVSVSRCGCAGVQ